MHRNKKILKLTKTNRIGSKTNSDQQQSLLLIYLYINYLYKNSIEKTYIPLVRWFVGRVFSVYFSKLCSIDFFLNMGFSGK